MLGRTPWHAMLLATVLLSSACARSGKLHHGAELATDALVQQLRDRTVPNPVQARMSLKANSKPLHLAVPRLGGGLIVDRPGDAFLVVNDPVGSPVITFTTHDGRVVILINREKKFVEKDDAAAALGQATQGSVRLEDAVSMLLGLLPVPDAEASAKEVVEGGVLLHFSGPSGVQIHALVDPALGTPVRVEVDDAQGKRALNATYEPFEEVDGSLLPTGVVLEVPSVELELDLRFRSWKALAQAPDVFSPTRPENYEAITFDQFLQGMAGTIDAGDTAPSE